MIHELSVYLTKGEIETLQNAFKANITYNEIAKIHTDRRMEICYNTTIKAEFEVIGLIEIILNKHGIRI